MLIYERRIKGLDRKYRNEIVLSTLDIPKSERAISKALIYEL